MHERRVGEGGGEWRRRNEEMAEGRRWGEDRESVERGFISQALFTRDGGHSPMSPMTRHEVE